MQKIFNFTNLFYFFISSNMWVTFILPTNLVIALISVILFITSVHIIKWNRGGIQLQCLILLLCLMSIWGVVTVAFSYGLLTFFYYLPAIFLFMLPLKNKILTLNFITKWFGVVMLISIGIYLATFFVELPSFGVFQLKENTYYPPYINYLFYIKSTDILDTIFLRFNGPFLEPGHLAVVSSMILMANRYEFKDNKWLCVSLACVILSFSLAGFVTTLLGYLFLKIRSIKFFILSLFLLGVVYLTVTEIWNGGNNVVNELIVSRLEFDDEKGIVGNNRTTDRTDEYFETQMKRGKLWTGLGSIDKDLYIVGAGYKIYFLRFGIISALLVFFFYLGLLPRHFNRRYVISFLIIIILTFMQRAYPWWYSWLLCFTLGVGCSCSVLHTKMQMQHKRCHLKLI